MGQTWDANPIHDVANIASDVGGFFTGPPGDPGRIRQAAQRVEHLDWEYRQHAAAVTEAVDALTQTWGGDAAQAFHGRWYAGGGQPGPAHLLSEMHDQLTAFAAGLRDYATRLENKQHDHWIQMAALAALTVVNAVQLGADPATDAAEVGMGTAVQIGSSLSLPAMTTFAGREAFALFASDLVGQLGAHVWDSLDPQSERNIVPFIDRGELASVLPLPACTVGGAGTAADDASGDGAGDGWSAPQQTTHGAERAADPSRLDSAEQSQVVARPTQTFTQADGAKVFVQDVNGRFNVVVRGRNGVVTNLKTISQRSLDRLVKGYGWRPD